MHPAYLTKLAPHVQYLFSRYQDSRKEQRFEFSPELDRKECMPSLADELGALDIATSCTFELFLHGFLLISSFDMNA